MVLILKKLVRGYFWLFNEQKDSRTDQFYLMSSPFQPALICIAYLCLIYKVLPEYMKNRTPFKLENILIGFNLVQVIVNGWICFNTFFEAISINWYCTPIDFSDTPHNNFILKVFYVFFATKIVDLLDTIFFILRGKTKQVSFLHVYHHWGMIAFCWVGMKFFGGGHSIYVVVVNSFVHTVMYFYYLLTAWKPEYKNNIWWKKYITQIQLLQFVFAFFTYAQLLFKPDCTYPKFVSYFIVPQSIFMIMLFGDFYWNAYIKPKRTSKQQ